MVERFCSSITAAQVRSNALAQRLQAFLVMFKRKLILSSVDDLSEDHQDRLLHSPLFSGQVFEPQTLDAVIKEHQGDVSTRSNEVLIRVMASTLTNVLNASKKRNVNISNSGPTQAGPSMSP